MGDGCLQKLTIKKGAIVAVMLAGIAPISMRQFQNQ
jgi:hypothetical protein